MSEPIDPILLCTVLPLQKLKRGGGDASAPKKSPTFPRTHCGGTTRI